jgi:hypothetical protein
VSRLLPKILIADDGAVSGRNRRQAPSAHMDGCAEAGDRRGVVIGGSAMANQREGAEIAFANRRRAAGGTWRVWASLRLFSGA